MNAWQHQADAIEFVQSLEAGPAGVGAGLFMDMGTGKTKVALDLLRDRGTDFWLCVAPKQVIAAGVWEREAAKWWPELAIVPLVKGTAAKKALLVAAIAARRAGPTAVLVNYESAWRRAPSGRKGLAGAIAEAGFGAVVLDEAARIKSASSRVSWFARSLHDRVPLRLALTGTPMPHSFLDAYGIYRFLDQRVFGSNFARFKLRYAVQAITPFGPKVTGIQEEQIEEFNRRLYSVAFRVTADEALDLPDVQHIDMPFDLTPAGRRAYGEMVETFIAELADGVITAANGAVKVLRLQQITGGWATGEDGEPREVDTAKCDALASMLDDLAEPVVVFCRFRSDLGNVRHATEAAGGTYHEISGRASELHEWEAAGTGLSVIGVQIQAGGSGIDLTRARVSIYYSTGFSLGDYEQSLARIHRPGQTRPVAYYHLLARGTIDVRVQRALEERADLIELLLSRELLEEPNGR